MATIDFGSARGEDLIPKIRHEVTRPLAKALLAKFPNARLGLYDFYWECGIAFSKIIDGEQHRMGIKLCGIHPNGEPFSYGMPDYDRFVKAIEKWLTS